jgi:hypothetical protein
VIKNGRKEFHQLVADKEFLAVLSKAATNTKKIVRSFASPPLLSFAFFFDFPPSSIFLLLAFLLSCFFFFFRTVRPETKPCYSFYR